MRNPDIEPAVRPPTRHAGRYGLAAVRQLLEVEGMDAARLAIRAGWPTERVAAIVAGEREATDAELAHLLACFGLNMRLEPLSPLVTPDDLAGGRDLSATCHRPIGSPPPPSSRACSRSWPTHGITDPRLDHRTRRPLRFGDLIDALDRHEVEYLVIGGFAVSPPP